MSSEDEQQPVVTVISTAIDTAPDESIPSDAASSGDGSTHDGADEDVELTHNTDVASSSSQEEYISTTQGYTIGGACRKLKDVLGLMASPLTDERGSTRSVIAGLATIVVVGTVIGLVVAPTNEVLSPSYRRVSAALGYTYFLAWSVSFYPQVISNFKRKSTVGLSPDFVVLNVIGFCCYTAYNTALYWNPSIRKLYKERYGPDAEITVQSNDVAFAIHALVLSVLTMLQIFYYNASCFRRSPTASNNDSAMKVSAPIRVVIIGIAILCTVYPLLVVVVNRLFQNNNFLDESLGKFNWLDYLYLLSYVKIFISLIKYMPQVLLNFRRKSTAGWSIWNILLDLTGGTLSDLQLVLDCSDLGDFTGITHNKAKLALGSLSIVFDLVFLVQHYCLYYSYSGESTSTGSAGTDDLGEPLLPEDDSEDPEEASVGQIVFV